MYLKPRLKSFLLVATFVMGGMFGLQGNAEAEHGFEPSCNGDFHDSQHLLNFFPSGHEQYEQIHIKLGENVGVCAHRVEGTAYFWEIEATNVNIIRIQKLAPEEDQSWKYPEVGKPTADRFVITGSSAGASSAVLSLRTAKAVSEKVMINVMVEEP